MHCTNPGKTGSSTDGLATWPSALLTHTQIFTTLSAWQHRAATAAPDLLAFPLLRKKDAPVTGRLQGRGTCALRNITRRNALLRVDPSAVPAAVATTATGTTTTTTGTATMTVRRPIATRRHALTATATVIATATATAVSAVATALPAPRRR